VLGTKNDEFLSAIFYILTYIYPLLLSRIYGLFALLAVISLELCLLIFSLSWFLSWLFNVSCNQVTYGVAAEVLLSYNELRLTKFRLKDSFTYFGVFMIFSLGFVRWVRVSLVPALWLGSTYAKTAFVLDVRLKDAVFCLCASSVLIFNFFAFLLAFYCNSCTEAGGGFRASSNAIQFVSLCPGIR